jgi:phosphate uptake regulator
MLVKVNIEDMTGRLLAQDKQAVECICEVDTAPNCAYVEVDEIPTTYIQRAYPDWAGESLTYAQIQELDNIVSQLGDDVNSVFIDGIRELKISITELAEAKQLIGSKFGDYKTINEIRLLVRCIKQDLALAEVLNIVTGGAL